MIPTIANILLCNILSIDSNLWRHFIPLMTFCCFEFVGNFDLNNVPVLRDRERDPNKERERDIFNRKLSSQDENRTSVLIMLSNNFYHLQIK